MRRGINKTIILGNVGADPEVRTMPGGGVVASLSVATTERWKNKQTGELQESTEWHRVEFFDRLAEITRDYVRKGGHIYIEGKIRTEKWQDRAGQNRYTTKIRGHELELLTPAPNSGDGSGDRASSTPPSLPADFKDEIPF